MKIAVYSIKGVKSGETTLPKSFDEKVNMNLLAQAVRVYDERSHTGLAKAQTRAEVNRTKKKLYKQKGTGGARHGSRRAPIFVGGGVAHGPRPIRRELTLPLKMKKKALATSLSLKEKNKQVVSVSGLEKMKKTKEAQTLVNKLLKELGGVKRLTFALSGSGKEANRVLRNIKNVFVVPYKNLNAHNVYFGGGLVIDKAVFEKTTKTQEEKKAVKTTKK